MQTTTLKIGGMTCQHCVQTVQKALESIHDVKKAEVNLALNQAVVQSDGPLDFQAANQAVEEAGYNILPF